MSETKIVDLLVVGGGPAGLAAALRARELDLLVLVIETDDLMRRIRDYSKEKLILPGFGGGDQMAFPAGGDRVEELVFGPIDKDELCARYRAACEQAGVFSRVGVELTGLQERGDDIYHATAYDHRQRREVYYLARHVALALGRGVPRRFDIPGNTEGIGFRLDDPQTLVGGPACVIGGGTSAAEAVIAISNAKAAAGDTTPIHWSYRGDKLPRVSKALAEVFFEAYAGNGNIRYHPLSEPMLGVLGEDRRPHLAIRVDRRHSEGRATEATLLEIPNDSVVACIGEDLPEGFLGSLGISMMVGGPRQRKRMVVRPTLESVLPRVYLLGDMLSQAYLETDDFTTDPSTFREIKHRGNIKSALRDGVLVAQVVRQRLDGHETISLEVADCSTPEPAAEELPAISAIFTSPPADAPQVQAMARREAAKAAIAWLVHHLPSGAEGDELPLADGARITLGQHGCDHSFPDDPHMSPRHASLEVRGQGAVLHDEDSAHGVFLSVPARRKIPLAAGDLLRVGRQFLLVEGLAGRYQVVHYDVQGQEKGRHTLGDGTTVFGRRGADVELDPADGTLSRRQLAITSSGGQLLTKDLMSANGTYLRVRGNTRLEHGDRFLVGQQQFVFSCQRDAVLDRGPSQSTSAFRLPHTEATEPAALDGPTVTFQPEGKICPARPGQTLLEVAEANGLKIIAECRSGICGSDPLKVITGHENLEAPPSAGEEETLEDLCGLQAGPCRLACMARIKGPVVVEVIER